jgi:hypothetical protein
VKALRDSSREPANGGSGSIALRHLAAQTTIMRHRCHQLSAPEHRVVHLCDTAVCHSSGYLIVPSSAELIAAQLG